MNYLKNLFFKKQFKKLEDKIEVNEKKISQISQQQCSINYYSSTIKKLNGQIELYEEQAKEHEKQIEKIYEEKWELKQKQDACKEEVITHEKTIKELKEELLELLKKNDALNNFINDEKKLKEQVIEERDELKALVKLKVPVKGESSDKKKKSSKK